MSLLIDLSHLFKWVTTGANRTFLLQDINLQIAEGATYISIGLCGRSDIIRSVGISSVRNS